jgi:hypothetical protein
MVQTANYMKKTCLFILLACVILSSCKRYKRTVKVCDGKLFVECFETNPMGVEADYLTDSSSFRMYVGKVDAEHQDYIYRCSNDSLIIDKYGMEQMDTSRRVLETRVFSLSKLKKDKKFD